MRGTRNKLKRILSFVLSAAVVGGMIPALGTVNARAVETEKIYAAAYQGAVTLGDTSLPQSVSVGGQQTAVTWSFDETTFAKAYDMVKVTGKAGGADVTAQVEVVPPKANPLVYFIDSCNTKQSVAYNSVKNLVGSTLKNEAADKVYTEGTWGYLSSNVKVKGEGNIDVTNKSLSGYYSSTKTDPLVYKLHLEKGTYTFSAGFHEWWNNRSMKIAIIYKVSAEGATDTVYSDEIDISTASPDATANVIVNVSEECDVEFDVTNASGGEAPVISWLAVAQGEVKAPEKTEVSEKTVNIDGSKAETSEANRFNGFGLLTCNNTSRLLLDYKEENPDEYWKIMEQMFDPINGAGMDHVKIEMGCDSNTSSGTEPSTMRSIDEEADVRRGAGWQIAADAIKINPKVKVSVLRWSQPGFVNNVWGKSLDDNKNGIDDGYEAMYQWYKNTAISAYKTYGITLSFVNPDRNETGTPDPDFIKWFAKRMKADTEFPGYNTIKIVASDENTSMKIGDDMMADEELRNLVDIIGYHYNLASTQNLLDLNSTYNKKIWYSEGVAPQTLQKYRANTDESFGGTASVLDLANRFIVMYTQGRRTHYIFQPAIGAFYSGSQYNPKELISANNPWSGFFESDIGVQMLQHFTQFAGSDWDNGWYYITDACYGVGGGGNSVVDGSGDGRYNRMVLTDKKDYTTVLVNDSDSEIKYTFNVKNITNAGSTVNVWETRGADNGKEYDANWKQKLASITPTQTADGYTYTFTIKPNSMVTLTTTNPEGITAYSRSDYAPSDNVKQDVLGLKADNTLSYSDNFEYDEYATAKAPQNAEYTKYYQADKAQNGSLDYVDRRSGTPRYTTDQGGAFEVQKDVDITHGNVLQQMINSDNKPGGWGTSPTPYTVLGDDRWANYVASIDFKLDSAVNSDNYVGLGVRNLYQYQDKDATSGYRLQVYRDGTWKLINLTSVVADGFINGFDASTWHTMSVKAAGSIITASVDGNQVVSYLDSTSSRSMTGRVCILSSYNNTMYDNLKVESIPGYAAASTRVDDEDSSVIYGKNVWNCVSGQSYNYHNRTKASNTAKNASFSVDFKGTGFDLIGASSSATINVKVTKKGTNEVAFEENGAVTAATSLRKASYVQRGLTYGDYTLNVTVTDGTFTLDAIDFMSDVVGGTSNKDALNAEIAKVKDTQKGSYTDATWAAFSNALSSAEKVAAKTVASQEEIDTALANLAGAVSQLVGLNTEQPKQDPVFISNSENNFAGMTKRGNTVVTDDDSKGKVLSMDGSTGSYASLNHDAINFDGRNTMTISMDVKSQMTTGNYFTFALGKDDQKYLFLRTRGNNVYMALTQNTWSGEDKISVDCSDTILNNWVRLVIVLEEGKMTVYENGTAIGTVNTNSNILDFGSNVLAYLGKSFYSGDTYFKGSFDNIEVYNRALTADEIKQKAVDKSQLNAVVLSAESKVQADYTSESWAPFAEALANAKKAQSGDVAQEAVNSALLTLNNAMQALQAKQPVIVDKSKLNEAISAAEAKVQADYTSESWAPFAEAMANAKKAKSGDVTQEAVNTAILALNNAMQALQAKQPVIVDKSKLNQAITAAEAKAQADYTSESWTPFAEALANAKKAQSGDATQEAVNTALLALNNAMNALKPKDNGGDHPQNQPIQLTDGSSGVTVTAAAGVLPENAQLLVTAVTSGTGYGLAVDALKDISGKIQLFDITILLNGDKIQPNGADVTVRIPVPQGFDTTKLVLFHIADDGTKTQIPFTLDGNTIVFTTPHFSYYAIADTSVSGNSGNTDSSSSSSDSNVSSEAGENSQSSETQPGTGESSTGLIVILVLLVLSGAALISFKASKEKTR